jgi:transcriptional regulator with XRE-family HTH domain
MVKNAAAYQTITGRRLPLSKLSRPEKEFLSSVRRKYHARLEWTRFAAWWNAEFTKSGLSTKSPVYRICQDLEARLGIHQGSVSPPDYRDFLADLIDGQFGSRLEFCRATGVDPGQLSRVFAGRADLSLHALQKVLAVLEAQLVIQTKEEARELTSIARAEEALALRGA